MAYQRLVLPCFPTSAEVGGVTGLGATLIGARVTPISGFGACDPEPPPDDGYWGRYTGASWAGGGGGGGGGGGSGGAGWLVNSGASPADIGCTLLGVGPVDGVFVGASGLGLRSSRGRSANNTATAMTASSTIRPRLVRYHGAGHDGGRVVFEGTPADLVAARSTLTGKHLADYVDA